MAKRIIDLTAVSTPLNAADVAWLEQAGAPRKVTIAQLRTDMGGAVSSVFTRTGAVVAVLSDYDASQVDNDSGVAGATVADALDTLDAEGPFMPTGGGTFTGNVTHNADLTLSNGNQLNLSDSTGITAFGQVDHPFQVGLAGSTPLLKVARAAIQAVNASQTAAEVLDLNPLGGDVHINGSAISPIGVGTVTGSTLRWSSTDWIETEAVQHAVTNSAQALRLKGGTTDHVYLAWFADAAAQAVRSGFMGFPGAGSEILTISNELGTLVQCTDAFQVDSDLSVRSAQPRFYLDDTNATVNERVWMMESANDTLRAYAANDARGSFGQWLRVNRTLNVIDAIVLDATELQTSARVEITGTTVGGSRNLSLNIVAGNCQFGMEDSNAGADVKVWRWANNAGTMTLSTMTDAYGTGNTALEFIRTGTTVDRMDVQAGTLRISTGAPTFELNETDEAADEKIWRVDSFGSAFRVATRTDAGGAGSDLFLATRTGTTINLLTIAPPVTISGACNFTAADGAPAAGSKVSTAQLYLSTRRVLRGDDASWLRINPDDAFTQGVLFESLVSIIEPLYITERAAALGDVAAKGQWWVLNSVPNLPMFENDAGGSQLLDPSISTINTQNANYTLVLGDKGKTIHKISGGAGETITIPANSSVAFPIGTLVCIQNDGGGTLTVAITTDTLTWAEDNTTGSRVIADGGLLLIHKLIATGWKCAGSQIT